MTGKSKLLCAALLLLGQALHATDVDGLFSKFSKQANVKQLKLDKNDKKLRELNRESRKEGIRIYSVRSMSLGECAPEVREDFQRQAEAMNTDSYELLMRSTEGGKTSVILIKKQNQRITELLVVITGAENNLLHLTGSAKLSLLNNADKTKIDFSFN